MAIRDTGAGAGGGAENKAEPRPSVDRSPGDWPLHPAPTWSWSGRDTAPLTVAQFFCRY